MRLRLSTASAAAFMLALTPLALAQTTTSVVQGATNVVIVNNNAAVTGISPGSAATYDATAVLPDGPYSGRSLWSHNGSVVALEARGNLRRFSYQRPRAGMAEAGAGPGSLLFEGRRVRDSYVGSARVFAGACGVFAYEVSGPVIEDRRVVVSGMVPLVSQRDCQIHGYRNDTLVFDLI